MPTSVPLQATSAAVASAYVIGTCHSSAEMLFKFIALGLAWAGWIMLPNSKMIQFEHSTQTIQVESPLELNDDIEFVKRSPVHASRNRDVTLEETLIEEKVVNGTLMRTCSKRMTTVVCPPEENEKHIQRFLNNDTNMLDMVAPPPAETTPVLVKSSSFVKSASIPSSPKAKSNPPTTTIAKKAPIEVKPKTWEQVLMPLLTWIAEKVWSTFSESLLTIALWSFCGIMWNSANNFNSDATFWSLFMKKLQDEYNYT